MKPERGDSATGLPPDMANFLRQAQAATAGAHDATVRAEQQAVVDQHADQAAAAPPTPERREEPDPPPRPEAPDPAAQASQSSGLSEQERINRFEYGLHPDDDDPIVYERDDTLHGRPVEMDSLQTDDKHGRAETVEAKTAAKPASATTESPEAAPKLPGGVPAVVQDHMPLQVFEAAKQLDMPGISPRERDTLSGNFSGKVDAATLFAAVDLFGAAVEDAQELVEERDERDAYELDPNSNEAIRERIRQSDEDRDQYLSGIRVNPLERLAARIATPAGTRRPGKIRKNRELRFQVYHSSLRHEQIKGPRAGRESVNNLQKSLAAGLRGYEELREAGSLEGLMQAHLGRQGGFTDEEIQSMHPDELDALSSAVLQALSEDTVKNEISRSSAFRTYGQVVMAKRAHDHDNSGALEDAQARAGLLQARAFGQILDNPHGRVDLTNGALDGDPRILALVLGQRARELVFDAPPENRFSGPAEAWLHAAGVNIAPPSQRITEANRFMFGAIEGYDYGRTPAQWLDARADRGLGVIPSYIPGERGMPYAAHVCNMIEARTRGQDPRNPDYWYTFLPSARIDIELQDGKLQEYSQVEPQYEDLLVFKGPFDDRHLIYRAYQDFMNGRTRQPHAARGEQAELRSDPAWHPRAIGRRIFHNYLGFEVGNLPDLTSNRRRVGR